MENRKPPSSRASFSGPLFFAVAPRSPVGKLVAGLLTLTFAVLALLMFGVILAGAVVLAAVGVLILSLKRPRNASASERRIGRVIEGEHTIVSVEERRRPTPDRRP